MANPVDPDLKKLIQDAEKPKMQYPPARAGWNGPETTQLKQAANPVYESLRGDSPVALQAELMALLKPDWRVVMAFIIVIFGLRSLRQREPMEATAIPLRASVIPMPGTAMPEQEAA